MCSTLFNCRESTIRAPYLAEVVGDLGQHALVSRFDCILHRSGIGGLVVVLVDEELNQSSIDELSLQGEVDLSIKDQSDQLLKVHLDLIIELVLQEHRL